MLQVAGLEGQDCPSPLEPGRCCHESQILVVQLLQGLVSVCVNSGPSLVCYSFDAFPFLPLGMDMFVSLYVRSMELGFLFFGEFLAKGLF